MNQFNAKGLLKRFAEFVTAESAARMLAGSRPTVRTEQLCDHFVRALDRAVEEADNAGFQDCANELGRLKKVVLRDGSNPAVIASSAETARWAVVHEFDRRLFLYIEPDRAQLRDQERLFGDGVYDAFPSARLDLRAAGDCLSVECSTAAVFHLMRAAEVALRALCDDRQVQYPDASLSTKTVGDLLGQLESKISPLRGRDKKLWPSADIKDAQCQFYHSALAEFRDINEAWRKHMAHAHESAFYDRDTARGIFGHVRTLMQTLSKKISEGSTTPEYWTQA